MKTAWVGLEVTEAAWERNPMVSGGLAWWREWGSAAIGWVADREVLAIGLQGVDTGIGALKWHRTNPFISGSDEVFTW